MAVHANLHRLVWEGSNTQEQASLTSGTSICRLYLSVVSFPNLHSCSDIFLRTLFPSSPLCSALVCWGGVGWGWGRQIAEGSGGTGVGEGAMGQVEEAGGRQRRGEQEGRGMEDEQG
eukprot:768358-Hanusia_phi.AAC.4